jgi:hypothetical protein
MRRCAALSATVLVLWIGAVPAARAQERGGPVVTVATTDANTPLFPLPESKGRVLTLPANTQLRVVGRYRAWYNVVFTDPGGTEVAGLVDPGSVTLQRSEAEPSGARALSQRGFFEGRTFGYFQTTSNDSERVVADGLQRQEIFARPASWFRIAAGLDLRANSHGQVEDRWRLDFDDRGALRPRAAVRRLTATMNSDHLTVVAGKQFIRWGRADILNPTDRFAPRDYLNVLDADFLPVLGVRSTLQFGHESIDVVYLPRMTPSRLPMLDQRWTVPPAGALGLTLADAGSDFPSGSEQGLRWNHTGGMLEASVSVFNGFNHLPDITATVNPATLTLNVARSYPDLRTYGADVAIPTKLVTLKGEAAVFTSPASTSEEFVLYVVELERQTGEWLLDGGYAGEVVTTSIAGIRFGAERGVARSFIGRAAYTVDPRRSIAIEGAVRQDGAGAYVKGEYSQTMGRHWRATVSSVGLGGNADDFLGQYRRNSHVALSLRFSY